MSLCYSIIEVTEKNLNDHPKVICFINPKHPSHGNKISWIIKQFSKGMRIKLLYIDGVKAPVGFVEYTTGEECWRAVDAKGYTFIHCIWTNGKKYQHQKLGEALIKEVEHDAVNTNGVALTASDGAFMVSPEIFKKLGYKSVASEGKDQLLVKKFKDVRDPQFYNFLKNREQYSQGLTILYSKQCPWVARLIDEMKPALEEYGLTPQVIELKTAQEAQQAPSLYSTFNLIYNGKLLSDRYISVTRLKNIIKKEIV